jgi:hypothetical protein
MPEEVEHCPFLNRADDRCGDHFSLDSLEHAFRYCFDRYKACPVYLELLVERRVRRVTGAVIEADLPAEVERPHAPSPFVQVRLPARYAKPAA